MDKATERRLLEWALKYGHFANSQYPATHEVKTREDVAKLSVSHDLARQAIESVQLCDINCDLLCREMHNGRALNVDGDAGPATLALIEIRRCQVPDFALADDDEFGLAGRGAWSDCDPKQEHHHEVVIKFDDRNASSTWKRYMPQVKKNLIRLSAEMGLALRYIDWDSNEKYQSSVFFGFISGGVIGFYYLPQRSLLWHSRSLSA